MEIGKGIFITVDGTEGSGKSTVLKKIKEKLEKIGVETLLTKEPGSPNDKVCQKLRAMVLDPENDIDSEAEIYLYMADRCQHVNKVVRPAIQEGKVVLSDRYIDSTYAYQGWGRRFGKPEAIEYINYLNEKTTGKLIPDLSIFILVDPEVGLQRVQSRDFEFGSQPDRIEQEKLDFHARLYEGFVDLYSRQKEFRNIMLINSTDKTKEQVESEVLDYVIKMIDLHIVKQNIEIGASV